jgi:PP-loop superfamily ATP-utilizing enzyme
MTYIVMTSSAHVKGKARLYGSYRNVAVVEVEEGAIPKMISERAKGVRRIVQHYGSRSVGKTEKCEYRRALSEAERLTAELNKAASNEERV